MFIEVHNTDNVILEKTIARDGDNIIRMICAVLNKRENLWFFRLSLADGSFEDFLDYNDAVARLTANVAPIND